MDFLPMRSATRRARLPSPLKELGVEEMNIRLVSGGTPFEEPCRVELVQAIAESSFDVHFTLDGARHVNAVKEH